MAAFWLARVHTQGQQTLSETAAMAAPDTARSASHAILHLLLTRPGTRRRQPAKIRLQGLHAQLAEVMPPSLSESQWSHFFHPFPPQRPPSPRPCKPAQPQQLSCDSDSNPRERGSCTIMPFLLHAPNLFPNSGAVALLSDSALESRGGHAGSEFSSEL